MWEKLLDLARIVYDNLGIGGLVVIYFLVRDWKFNDSHVKLLSAQQEFQNTCLKHQETMSEALKDGFEHIQHELSKIKETTAILKDRTDR